MGANYFFYPYWRFGMRSYYLSFLLLLSGGVILFGGAWFAGNLPWYDLAFAQQGLHTFASPGFPDDKYIVPKTGQTISYGSRDDGALQMGRTWPSPRFTVNGNGTVTDQLSGLI
jgi:hypothetical protein